jgi:hypothetical protein
MVSEINIYDDVAGLERYLNLPLGSLSGIPYYARRPAIDAILKLKKMEQASLFRPGLYYIVLADLCGNTAFNAKYGNAEGDIRVEWFQTAVIQSLGEIDVRNYAAFCKAIADASLLIFSSFEDVYLWSGRLAINLSSLSSDYSLRLKNLEVDDDEIDHRVKDFALRARRFVHLGEVAYKDGTDPLCLAVSQAFKIEKIFAEEHLGCTQAVADAIGPKLPELKLELISNKAASLPGIKAEFMTYYVKPKPK